MLQSCAFYLLFVIFLAAESFCDPQPIEIVGNPRHVSEATFLASAFGR